MKKYGITFLFIAAFTLCKSQNPIDSLKAIVEGSEDANKKYSALGKLTEICDLEIVPVYVNKATELFNSPELIINRSVYSSKSNILGNYAFYLSSIGDLDSAIHYYHESIEIDRHILDFESLMVDFINVASVYQDKGQNKMALDFAFKGLNLATSMGNNPGRSYAMNIISKSYEIAGDFRLTLDYQYQILGQEISDGTVEDQAIAHNNIAAMYANLGDTDSAEYHYLKSLDLYKKEKNDYGLMMTYCNLGKFKYESMELELSEYYLNIADSLSVLVGDLRWQSRILSNRSELNYLKKDFSLGLKQGKKSFEISMDLENPQLIMESSRVLSKNALKTGDYQLAAEQIANFYEYKDSLEGQEAKSLVLQKELDYQYEKKKLADSLNYIKKKELSDFEYQIQIKEEQQQKYYLYAGILFLGALGIALYRNYSLKKKDNEIITEQKQKVELQKAIIEESHLEIRDSINYAQRIQSAILPSDEEFQTHFQKGFVIYLPKDVVAGDFYWLHDLSDRVLISAADCTGHGVPGALVSVVCNNALNRSLREENLKNTNEILDKTREIVVEEFSKSQINVKDGMDLALVALFKQGNTIQFSGANNPLWIVRKNSTEIEEYKADKQPVGNYEFSTPFTLNEISLSLGDRFYIFSDGFIDQFGGESGKKYKSKPFKRYLLSIQDRSMAEQKSLIQDEFERWKGPQEAIDDVCIIGIEIT